MKIVLFGIYGGSGRDFNPGCFLLASNTVNALRERIPEAEFEVIAPDKFFGDAAPATETVDGITINFDRAQFESCMASADGLVIGGDNLWSLPTMPVWKRFARWILNRFDAYRLPFLLEEWDLLRKDKPVVVFNCVSSRSSEKVLMQWSRPLSRCCKRAAYVGVRDTSLDNVLRKNMGWPNVFKVPDPVLGLHPETLSPESVPPLPKSDKPILGVALRPSWVGAFAVAFENLKSEFDRYHVCFYSYSRMHQHSAAHAALRRWISGDVSFIDAPMTPSEAYSLTGRFDVVLNDCYHGTIAAIINEKPIVPVRFRDPDISRRSQLFDLLGVPDKSIRISDPNRPVNHNGNVENLLEQLPALLREPLPIPAESLARARSAVERHYDDMATALKNG
jgi:hypothetical protein